MCATKPLQQFDNILQLVTYFKDEKMCLKYLQASLYGEGRMVCPRCKHEDPYKYQDGITFKCRVCTHKFNAKGGTIFSDSRLPLLKWFMAMYLIGSHKKGISSCQLARDLGVTQKTAWHMAHKIRKSMQQVSYEQLDGVIEIDETFVGGKNKNRHKDKKVKKYEEGRMYPDKTPVFGMLKRNGEVRTFVVADTTKKSLRPIIRENIKEKSTVYSDDWGAYDTLYRRYNYDSVKHSVGRYRDGDTCTNGIESFWSHLKRSIIGIYHKVSPKHLQKYVDEVTFRFNHRKMSQGERLIQLIAQSTYKVTYKQIVNG